MSSFAFEVNPTKRRVPDSARRRALVSCDRCKTKRIRCDRPNQDVTCESCRNNKAPCKSTIPRKRMVSSGSDSIDLRYKALDTLVRGLFPNEDCEDLQTLRRLDVERGIPVAGFGATSDTFDFSTALNTERSEPSRAVDTNTSPGTLQIEPATDTSSIISPASQSTVSHNAQWPRNLDSAIQAAVAKLPEETCIAAPHGVSHYVGPASSFDFATAVRRLVTKRTQLLGGKNKRHDRRSKLRADFANLKTSIALEPRIETHPAATVREHNDADQISVPTSTPTTRRTPSIRPDHRSPSRFGPSDDDALRALLPVRSVSDELIRVFFERLHPNYVLFHRGTFFTRYELIWQNPSTHNNNPDHGWLSCLFLMYVFGAQSMERDSSQDGAGIQRKFLKLVRERFHHLALTASLANVQALLLLQLYEHNAGERNTSWILLGQAARMAIALGMHREGTAHKFDPIERNVRKMVWHTLYSFEQFSSLVLGRPSAIKSLDVNIRLPDETVLDGNDCPPNYFAHNGRLLDLASKVRHFATGSSPHAFESKFLASMRDSMTTISEELSTWYQRLPRHLRPEWQFISPRHLRAVLVLHINYHYLCSVLTRPYLLCKVDHDIEQQDNSSPFQGSPSRGRSEITEPAQQCITSSLEVAHLLQRLDADNLLDGSMWTDFFYLYHSLLCLCLPFLGRAQPANDTQWASEEREISASVCIMLDMCSTHHLAPTFRILCRVALQFADIVGLAGDHGMSRADSERPPDTDAAPEAAQDTRARESVSNINAMMMGPTDWQNNTFMPFTDIPHFNDNNMVWDFFDMNDTDPVHASSSFSFSSGHIWAQQSENFPHDPYLGGSMWYA